MTADLALVALGAWLIWSACAADEYVSVSERRAAVLIVGNFVLGIVVVAAGVVMAIARALPW